MQLLLPMLLYKLIPCAWTAKLALMGMPRERNLSAVLMHSLKFDSSCLTCEGKGQLLWCC